MATGTEQAQSHLSTCPEHTHQLLLSYCRTCHKRVCEKCVKGPHSEHDWTFLQNHVREVRNEGHKIAKEIREEVLAFLKSKRDGTTRKQEVAKIRRMQATLKNLIDEYAEEMVALIDDNNDSTDVGNEIEEFEKLANFFEKDVQREYDSVVLEMEEELHTKLRQYRTSKAASNGKVLRFQEGAINKPVIRDMMGRVDKENEQNSSKLDVTDVRTLTRGEEFISSIQDISDKEFWIHIKKSQKVSLIDCDGNTVKTRIYQTQYTDFIVRDDTHIFTYHTEKYIGSLSIGLKREICSTAPLSPTGICYSRDGGMLVCLTDCAISDITPSSTGEVHHMDMTGRIKKSFYQDTTDRKKLFRFPYRVAQNINYDLCVCDVVERDRRHWLVVVTEDSRIRFTYEGHSSLKQKLTANAVVCDSAGRIILSDRYNHAIHMISAEGHFIQFLLNSNDLLSNPTVLALHGDIMWVGNNKGIIKICKLKQRS